jgi:hypothetical protein
VGFGVCPVSGNGKMDKQPQKNVISLLERALSDAKEGKIQALVFVFAEPDGLTYHSWAWDALPQITPLVGELDRAKLQLLLRFAPPRAVDGAALGALDL